MLFHILFVLSILRKGSGNQQFTENFPTDPIWLYMYQKKKMDWFEGGLVKIESTEKGKL